MTAVIEPEYKPSSTNSMFRSVPSSNTARSTTTVVLIFARTTVSSVRTCVEVIESRSPGKVSVIAIIVPFGDGESVGESVGEVVGDIDGEMDGEMDGEEVGSMVGEMVGESVQPWHVNSHTSNQMPEGIPLRNGLCSRHKPSLNACRHSGLSQMSKIS